jgi:hypothetical protein
VEKKMTKKITDSDYHAHPGFNQSTARQLLSKSPMHAFEYRRLQAAKRGKPDPDHDRDCEIGTVTHKLLLGSTTGYRELDYKDYRTKEAQEHRTSCETEGVTPILSGDLERCARSVNAVREQLRDVFGIELDGESERVIFWDQSVPDPMNGRTAAVVPCKARLDHVRDDGLTILDLKTGSDANPKGLMRRILDAGCHVQAACYKRALESTDGRKVGRVRFIDVFVETRGLVLSTPVEITGSLLELGDRAWLRACLRWHQCQQEGLYPGYTQAVLAPPAPEWALKEEMANE